MEKDRKTVQREVDYRSSGKEKLEKGETMKFPYSQKVLEHFKNPHNVGKMENPDGKVLKEARLAETWLQFILRSIPIPRLLKT